jgi:cytochrome c biogenesis protein CcdA
MSKEVKQKIIIMLYFILSSLYAQPRIQFESEVVDFGKMKQMEIKTKTVSFRNVGNEILEVREIRSSCGCTAGAIDVKNRMVKPRSTGTIEVTFNSKGYRGNVSKNLYITTNDPEKPRVYLNIRAMVELPPGDSPIQVYFFYSDDCEECSFVEEKILKSLREKYKLKIRSFDLSEPSNYEYLVSLEDKYGDRNNKIPVVVIGKYLLGGVEEIERGLENRVLEYEEKGFVPSDLKINGFPSQEFYGEVEIAYFFDNKCRVCERISYEILYLEKMYPNLKISKYNLNRRENKKLNEAFCEVYNVPEKRRLTSPMIFIGEEYLCGEDLEEKSLKELICEYKDKGAEIPWNRIFELRDEAEKNIKERFKNMSAFTIILAGLLDGVNPCAFATIIFLIAFLSTLGKKEEEMLLIGITYSTVVFLVYFSIGLGLIKFVGILKITSIIGKIILGGLALLAMSFGVLSFYDYIKLKRNEVEDVKLQLPRFLKKKIHSVIREKMGKKNLFIAAVLSGFFISLSEFICTGQIYLPTLIFVSRIPELKVRAILYLIVYNISFIVPLVIVFFAAYKGMKSSVINKFWGNKVKFVKLATSFFFVFLGLFIAFYIFFY